MKIQITIAIFLVQLFCYGQAQMTSDSTIDLVIKYKPANIVLLKGTVEIIFSGAGLPSCALPLLDLQFQEVNLK